VGSGTQYGRSGIDVYSIVEARSGQNHASTGLQHGREKLSATLDSARALARPRSQRARAQQKQQPLHADPHTGPWAEGSARPRAALAEPAPRTRGRARGKAAARAACCGRQNGPPTRACGRREAPPTR
jgi:hypothetical protein